jgi:hypothetical protein
LERSGEVFGYGWNTSSILSEAVEEEEEEKD